MEEEQRYLRPDGSTAWPDRHGISRRPPRSGDPYVFAQYRDISDHKHAQEELGYQAAHDPLTGLANRGMLMERLDAALASGPAGEPVSA